jgi:hypothetical protein
MVSKSEACQPLRGLSTPFRGMIRTGNSFTLTGGRRRVSVEAVTDPEQSVFVVSEPG